MKKIAGFTIIGLLSALVAVSAWAWTHPVDKQASVPPTQTSAKYIVTTQTRIYYTDKYTLSKDGNILVLHGYYASKVNQWIFYDMDLTLNSRYIRFNAPVLRPVGG